VRLRLASTAQTHPGIPGFRQWSLGPFLASCAGPFPLYCFVDSNVAAVTAQAAGRVLFVSRQDFSPSTGRAAADAIYQQEAADAHLPGSFLALLATTAEPAEARFDLGGPPWVRPDAVRVVDRADQLLGDEALAPVYLNADGHPDQGLSFVWTGGLASPRTSAMTCGDWSSNSGAGDGGDDGRIDFWLWEYRASLTCQGALHVYCAQK